MGGQTWRPCSFPWRGASPRAGGGKRPLRPGSAPGSSPGRGLAGDTSARKADVVAGARVHRELALDRVPVVVLLDEDVEVVEPPRSRQGAPAAREDARILGALLLQRPVGAREALFLGATPWSISSRRSIQRGRTPP